MRVLVACEFSGVVRDAFIRTGHDAVSCDLLPTESAGPHITGNVLDVLDDGFDLMIAHPPCTHLSSSGARWFSKKRPEQDEAMAFVRAMWNAPIDRIAIENPVGVISTLMRPPDQIVQPWQFGHGELKGTCFWLKNLPVLVPTNVVGGREQRIWRLSPSETRWKERSKTFAGIADAMAHQWSSRELRWHRKQLSFNFHAVTA